MNAQAKVSNLIEVNSETVESFASSLRTRVIGSAAFSLGFKLIRKCEELGKLIAAEERFGRRKINISTGEPARDELELEIEEVAAAYGACQDALGEAAARTELFALVEKSADPYVRQATPEQWAIRAEAAGKPIDTLRQQAAERAERQAKVRYQNASSILGEAESRLAFAPDRELADIELASLIGKDWAEVVEAQVKQYRNGVAMGYIYDDADMLLFNADVKSIGL